MKFITKRIAYGAHQSQFGDLRIPEGDGPHPVVISIHGGFWRAKHGLNLNDALADDFTSRGIATWNIEYRKVGEDGGGWPGTLVDVANAADYLYKIAPEYNLDLKRVVVVGHSAGGHLGLWLAARDLLPEGSVLKTAGQPLPIKTVVSLAGVCDFALMESTHRIKMELFGNYGAEGNPVAELMGGSPLEVPERYAQASPIQLLSLQSRQILIHGTLDINVPIGISYRYYREATAAGADVKMVELQYAEHFKVIMPNSDIWPLVVREVLNEVKM